MARFGEPGLLALMVTSSLVVFVGLGLGLVDLRKTSRPSAEEPDALERAIPPVWAVLRDKFYVDELYGVTVIAFYAWWAQVADWLDRRVWGGVVAGVAWGFRVMGAAESLSRYAMWWTAALTRAAKSWPSGGGLLARVQTGRVQTYLRLLALAVVVLAAILIWSSRG